MSRSFAGEKTPAKASFLQILKSKVGTPTGAETGRSGTLRPTGD